jgi:hypothetical protein
MSFIRVVETYKSVCTVRMRFDVQRSSLMCLSKIEISGFEVAPKADQFKISMTWRRFGREVQAYCGCCWVVGATLLLQLLSASFNDCCLVVIHRKLEL